MTSPGDVAKLLRDALETQPTIIGHPNGDDLLTLKKKLLNILQTISYDRADRFHHVVGVMQMESAYMANHNSIAFPIPKRLGLWDDKIAKDATVKEMKKAKVIHKACSEDYKIWKMAEDGCKKLICAAVEEVYINELKDGTTFFHKVLRVTSPNTWRKTLQVSMPLTSYHCAQTCSSSTKMWQACLTSS